MTSIQQLRTFLHERSPRHKRALRWTKHKESDGMGRFCLVGGINHLLHSNQHRMAHRIIGQVASEQYPERTNGRTGYSAIIAFNDHAQTKWADVDRVLEKADIRAQEEFFAEGSDI